MTHNHDDTDAMLNEMMARGREAQNSAVRTREEQIEALTSQFGEEGTFSYVDDRDAATRHILEAEARGAAEQRRRDAEGQEPVAWAIPDQMPDNEYPRVGANLSRRKGYGNVLALYTHPANVAALEARIAELEKALGRISSTGSDYFSPSGHIACVDIASAALTREGGV